MAIDDKGNEKFLATMIKLTNCYKVACVTIEKMKPQLSEYGEIISIIKDYLNRCQECKDNPELEEPDARNYLGSIIKIITGRL